MHANDVSLKVENVKDNNKLKNIFFRNILNTLMPKTPKWTHF